MSLSGVLGIGRARDPVVRHDATVGQRVASPTAGGLGCALSGYSGVVLG